jgi:hypothetical protein
MRSLGTPRSARESFGCTWEHLGAPARSRGAPKTSLEVLATSLGAPRIPLEQSRNNIFFGDAAAAPGNHRYYLSFNDFYNSCFQIVFSSMYLCINVCMYHYSYPSTHAKSGLAAGGA